MAFVNRFAHDVFVSYAHADDFPDASGHGWVSQFVVALKAALRSALGGSDELKLYFDRSHLHANHQVPELEVAARNSAVFLAVASRSYARRPWPQSELGAFVRNAGDPRRLFAVEYLPLDRAQEYPPPLQQQKRASFWRPIEPHSESPVPLSPTSDEFRQRVWDVAEQIRKQLEALCNAGDAVNQSATKPASQLGLRRTVLLAQVTEDLGDEREQLRRYLEQYGVAILPQATYPQDGLRFRQAFEADLRRADLFVQLLGKYRARTPPDLPEGYTRTQFAIAEASGVEIMQWRRSDLAVESVENAQQCELLTGEHVMASGLESFKAEVLARTSPQPPAPAKPSEASPLIFVNADRDDMAIAEQIEKEIRNHGFSPVIPWLDGSAEEIRRDLDGCLMDCDAMVLIYGQASPVWVRTQGRRYIKMRGMRPVPPRVLVLYYGPPEQKHDIRFSVPELREIDGRRVPVDEPVPPLIEALRA
jgi:hypothetical protein